MLPNTISQDRGKDWTSLHEAAANGNEEMIKTLLAGNADITLKETKLGNTPLHEAASRGFSRSVKLLCTPKTSTKPTSKSKQKKEAEAKQTRGSAQNAMLSVQNFAGFTPLHLAAQNGHNQSCRELLLAGANPDVENYYGDTALHTACRYGHAGAARILISAFCDVNKKNLNGDTPLHITSAMGRHKLSRILLEAECEIHARNSQCETPRDIAIRKGFVKILDILDNPHRLRNKKGKPVAGDEDKAKSGPCTSKSHSNEVSWSPYGCHYFPDMRAFPSPKLETLPKEPLKSGEQYYLDLAGHIRKGPIGIGNICYCGPFFKHIENKINSNKRHLRKYVHNAKEHLDDKVQALAERTNHQIEKLTRTMIAERVECENRRLHIENYLKRGCPHRLTTDLTSSKGRETRETFDTLKRCRSLEFLEKADLMEGKMANSRSFDLLDSNANEAAVFSEKDDQMLCCQNVAELQKHLTDDRNAEFCDVSKRLDSLLAKTSTFLKVPPVDNGPAGTELTASPLGINTTTNVELQARLQNMHLSPSASDTSHATPAQTSSEPGAVSSPDYNCNSRRTHTSAAAKRKTIVAPPEELTTASSTVSPVDVDRHRDKQLEYLYEMQKRGSVIQNVISALRKSHQRTDIMPDVKTRNESEHQQEDKLGYKDVLFQVHRLVDADSREMEMLREVGLPLENFSIAQSENFSKISDAQTTHGPLTTTDHFQQSAPGVRYQDSSYTESYPGEDCPDSSEYVKQQRHQFVSSDNSPLYAEKISKNKSSILCGSKSTKTADSPDSQNYVFQTSYWPERYIPKDAYFHDLTQRKCNVASPSAAAAIPSATDTTELTNALSKFSVANAVKNIESFNGQVLGNAYIRDTTVRAGSAPNTKPRHLPPVTAIINTNQQNGYVECALPVCNGNGSYRLETNAAAGASPTHVGRMEDRGGQKLFVENGKTLTVESPSKTLNDTACIITTAAAIHNGGQPYTYSHDEAVDIGDQARLSASAYYASNVSSLV